MENQQQQLPQPSLLQPSSPQPTPQPAPPRPQNRCQRGTRSAVPARCPRRVTTSVACSAFHQKRREQPWFLFRGGFYSLAMLGCLTAVIYMMLDYQCHAGNRNTLFQLNKSMLEIVNNFSKMQRNYIEMESIINNLAQELPRVQGKMEILEAFANELGNDFVPHSNLFLSYVDDRAKIEMGSGDHIT